MSTLAFALGAAALLGLRHATDPDHVTAVSTLVMSEERRSWRRASGLGLAWGLGHATMLFTLGLPLVLLGRGLPNGVEQAAEAGTARALAARGVRRPPRARSHSAGRRSPAAWRRSLPLSARSR